jgi:hypothetical protein
MTTTPQVRDIPWAGKERFHFRRITGASVEYQVSSSPTTAVQPRRSFGAPKNAERKKKKDVMTGVGLEPTLSFPNQEIVY